MEVINAVVHLINGDIIKIDWLDIDVVRIMCKFGDKCYMFPENSVKFLEFTPKNKNKKTR